VNCESVVPEPEESDQHFILNARRSTLNNNNLEYSLSDTYNDVDFLYGCELPPKISTCSTSGANPKRGWTFHIYGSNGRERFSE
jgi:hypothetical protein